LPDVQPGKGDLVRKEGLEPTCLSALEPKSSASTNSATFAVGELYPNSLRPRITSRPRSARYNPENSKASASPLPVDHYENFPVASWLLPARLRPPIEAIYAFARGADDIADEGEMPDAARLEGLERYRRALDRIESGETPSEAPFGRLAGAVREYNLPIALLRDLLDAFSQDVTTRRYATYAELLDYSRRSANPIGRLVLHCFEKTSGGAGSQPGFSREHSDAICSALQFINFWQDVAVDWRKDRVYLPAEDLERFGVTVEHIAQQRVDDNWRALMEFECSRSRALLMSGRPLGQALPGRLGIEIRATLHGGARILDKIEAAGGDVFRQRPMLSKGDWMGILARAAIA
jgi:squalene synthase HpnC